jgi:ATP-dependent Clp protease protease subunit
MSFTIWCALEELSKQDPDKEITLVINSLGGRVHDMFAIADAMLLCPTPIRTIGTGIIASAATLIIAAGTPGRRFLTSACMVMTHDLQWGYYTSLSELSSVADAGKKMQTRYHKMMSQFSGRPVREIKELLSGQGNWFGAREAIRKLGLADHILSKRELHA